MAEKPKHPRGLYERLLAEATGRKSWTGYLKRVDSPVLKKLEARTPLDRPEYMQDLVGLHSLIRNGGPDNWASSVRFGFLKDLYPDEYEMLREEHLGKGKTLREGFRHGRVFAREELESINVNEDLVFCENLFDEGAPVARYAMFHHEADVVLFGLAHEVEEGTMADAEAWEVWEPYRWLCPHFYNRDWRDWRGFGGPAGFPSTDWIEQGETATDRFDRDAGACGVPGVNFVSEERRTDSPFPIGNLFEVESRQALETLRGELSGRYRILVRDKSEYLPLSTGLRGATDLLNRAITEPDDVRSE